MRDDNEIYEQTDELARKFYSLMGYNVKEGYHFQFATHPQELMCWEMARIAQIELTETDPNDICIED